MSRVISVIIPTYNREAFVLEAVQSVLHQKIPSGFSLEVIVIDDGSTDNTRAVLAPLKGKITYEWMSNSGCPAVPRNVGIKLSHGEFIAFQDSDDRWVEDKLVHQVKSFDDETVGISHGGVQE